MMKQREHWNININLIKNQIILNNLKSSFAETKNCRIFSLTVEEFEN